MSTLRAVSPLHLQYLRNMGVRASVVLSLIHQGKLWGMLVCHHSTPRLPPRHMTHALCVASELILGNVTSHVVSLLALEQARHALGIQRALARLERTLEHMGQQFLLDHAAEDLKTTFRADGLCICMGDEVLCGEPLPLGLMQRLEQYWEDSQELVFETHAIRETWPDACPEDWPYAGVLACQLGQEARAWVVMLRRERVQRIQWAGNPHGKSGRPLDEPLTPRASFATWVESVRHQAEAWHANESHAILELSRLILLRRKSWELRRYQATLRDFLEKQEKTLLKERARMALLVHDQLGQLMAAARMKISALDDNGAQSAKDDLEEAMEMARNLSHHLYPLALRHGLVPALESLVDDFSQRYPLRLELETCDAIPTINEQVAEVYYGIAREALNNVVKHARAQNAQMTLRIETGWLHLQIADDGIGLPPHLLPTGQHFGMFGMHERARWIQADLSIERGPEGGTQVHLRWPLPTHGESA